MANLEENINNEIDIKHDEPVKIHLDEESAEVTAVEGDYGANQIQILLHHHLKTHNADNSYIHNEVLVDLLL